MGIPVYVSAATALPLTVRMAFAFRYRDVVLRGIPSPQKRVDQHRSLLNQLAAFSLAGLALVGIQSDRKFGPPLFDIVVSCLCFLGSIGMQSWKRLWVHDLVADGLRDAASTALILFAVRLVFAVGPGLGWAEWQLGLVAVLAAAMWVADTWLHVWYVSEAIPYLQGDRNE